MKSSYEIDPAFRKFSRVRMPNNLFWLAFFNALMTFGNLFYRPERTYQRFDTTIRSWDDQPLKITVYRPKENGIPRPGVVYFPGGAYMMCPTPMHHRTAANLAKEAGANVVMVTYRLAPKYPFPCALNDALMAWDHVIKYYDRYGIDPSRIAIAGESAGGNLSAAVTLYAKDHHTQMPCGELLMYPALDQGHNSESRKKYTDTPMIAAKNFAFVNKHYYRNGYGDWERYAVPLTHPDVSGLPPTYIETAEFDPLSDDGKLYAIKLAKAGVDVMFWPTKGTIHGYDIVRSASITLLCMSRRIQWFQQIFANHPSNK